MGHPRLRRRRRPPRTTIRSTITARSTSSSITPSIYQPIGNGGDFISIAGHYNQQPQQLLRLGAAASGLTRSPTGASRRNVGQLARNRYPRNNDEREYDINFPCTIDVATGRRRRRAGLRPSNSQLRHRIRPPHNPSNTGNIRGSSRFTLTDGSSSPSTPATNMSRPTAAAPSPPVNLAMTSTRPVAAPTARRPRTAPASIASRLLRRRPYCRRRPQRRRRCPRPGHGRCRRARRAPDRYGVIAGLRWTSTTTHRPRVATPTTCQPSPDRRSRPARGDGEPFDVFPVNDPRPEFDGVNLQKRDR